jgi:ubiquinone/menaquinone biosynthesis C-methylase UbiE
MSFYGRRVLPHLIHIGMRQDSLRPYRLRLVAGARGRVLEIGVGSGLNLPLYGATVQRVLAIDPSPELLAMTHRQLGGLPVSADLVEGSAEVLPLERASVDTVVTSWTLCSIADVGKALREAHRVLKPDGELRFVEHGRAPDAAVQRWQDLLTPAWKRLAGGCHLNRSIPELLKDAGFAVERLATGYMAGPKPLTFMYEGVARPVAASGPAISPSTTESGAPSR